MERDPERIEPMLQLLEIAWTANPDLRLAQLVLAAHSLSNSKADPFYVEDDELATGFLSMTQRES